MARTSAGILLYRVRDGVIEVLLVHPGGPFFAHKDLGNWSIPKGEVDGTDDGLETAAAREFEEETGHPVPVGPRLELGWVRQRSGKTVWAWAVEGDIDTATMTSNFIEFDWPPIIGHRNRFPEIDRWEYFGPVQARSHMKPAQIPFLDRLETALLARVASGGHGTESPGGESR